MITEPFHRLGDFFEAWGTSFDGAEFISREKLPWKVVISKNLGSLQGHWVSWWPECLRNTTEIEQIAFAIDFLEQNGPLLDRLAEQTEERRLAIQRNLTVTRATGGAIVQIPDTLTRLLYVRRVTLYVAFGTRIPYNDENDV